MLIVRCDGELALIALAFTTDDFGNAVQLTLRQLLQLEHFRRG